MNAWRRLALVYLGLLFLSMVSTRFQVVPPLALSSGVLPVTRVFDGAADHVRGAYETLVNDRDARHRLEVLRDQNEVLRGRNDVLERENARLREAAQIRATQFPGPVSVASVVMVDPSPLLSRLTVDKGARDGVRRFMPASVPSGLVGQVTGVAANTAVVTTILDPESRVGVTLRGKGGRGLAVGAPPDRLRATFPLTVDVKVGDTVLTSSLGGVYPVGIKVGTVERVEQVGPNDVNRTVIVKPSADVSTLEEVALLEALP
ncbi:rod shape-determining protein MreC [Deinococcus pimensis]|uniref:rod shape-determining protein MreC n=1 Tax=Deinococcus pimensis TaxID=309888 RepID=UPI0004815FF7|nr:rod shape-determining protein MreC [Deinococcus pimensis]